MGDLKGMHVRIVVTRSTQIRHVKKTKVICVKDPHVRNGSLNMTAVDAADLPAATKPASSSSVAVYRIPTAPWA